MHVRDHIAFTDKYIVGGREVSKEEYLAHREANPLPKGLIDNNGKGGSSSTTESTDAIDKRNAATTYGGGVFKSARPLRTPPIGHPETITSSTQMMEELTEAGKNLQSSITNEFTQVAQGRVGAPRPAKSEPIVSVAPLTPTSPKVNNFAPRPKPPRTGSGQQRVAYKDINGLFKDKFLRNYLYINQVGQDGTNLTSYNITLFTLPESSCLGAKMNRIAIDGYHAYPEAIVITQSGGTDEFYLEDLEFTSVIGKKPDEGTGTPPRDVSFTIKAPTNNDFIDQLMKAAIVGGWKSHMDMALFMHIEWKGRSVNTDAPIAQVNNEYRCFPLKITASGGASINEGGSTYSMSCQGYSASSFNNQVGLVKEDGSISGKTVGELLARLVQELFRSAQRGQDNMLIPDEIYIEFPKENGGGVNKIYNYNMVTSNAKEFANLATQKNENSHNKKTSTGSENPGKFVTTAPANSDVSVVAKSKYAPEIEMTSSRVTFHLKAGMSIKDIIVKIVSHTKEAQQMIAGIPDAEDSEAMKKKKDVDPASYMREFITITSDVELKAWDSAQRKYAARHFIKVTEYKAPSYSEAEQITTKQDKQTSMDRLMGMLNDNFIRKCYHHIHTGLNTEIKSLDWNFDNTLFFASNLYSGVVASYNQRAHGKRLGMADDGTSHLGFADAALNAKRAIDEAKVEAAQAVADAKTEAEKKAEKAKKLAKQAKNGNFAGGPPGSESRSLLNAQEAEKEATEAAAQLKQRQKEFKDKIAKLRSDELIAQLQGSADVKRGSITTQIVSFEEGGDQTAFLKGLGANAQAFQTADGRVQVIRWEAASLPVALAPKKGGTMLSDVTDDIVIDSIKTGSMFPVQFASTRLGETEQGGIRKDHDKGKNVFAEIYQNRNVEMMKISMVIRGDPYWIPNIGQMLYMTGADVIESKVGQTEKAVAARAAANPNFSVSPSAQESYCIIIADQANTYEPATGVMKIKERNSLNGVYLVTQVKHQFSGGEFTQELEMVRSTGIDLNAVFGGYSLADAARAQKEIADNGGTHHVAEKFEALDTAAAMGDIGT